MSSSSNPSSRQLGAIPREERPRERIARQGVRALSDMELLSVLLRTGGRRGRSVFDLALGLLENLGGLGGLIGTTFEGLRRFGVGPSQAAVLVAALELGKRLTRAQLPQRRPMTHPGAVADYLSLQFTTPGQEIMGALFLDSRNRLLSEKEIYRGTLNRAAVEPRALLKEGLLRDAAGFILFHTHPSGDPSPSVEDLAFTRRIAQSGELVGVRLVDHLIVGAGGTFVSLRERGGW